MDVRIIRSGTKRRNVPPIVRKEAVFAAAFTHAVRAGAHKAVPAILRFSLTIFSWLTFSCAETVAAGTLLDSAVRSGDAAPAEMEETGIP